MQERLQKVLARAGFASRRGAEQLMGEGRVTVNGEIVREPGTKADPATDDIRVDGVRVKASVALVYIVLNKPRGVVTTRRDPAGRRTVMDLVPGVAGLFPVGRLDVTTEGLILLTNDGAFAERVAHPRYEVPRVYHAKVHRAPDTRALERLHRGIRIEGELLKADRVRVLDSGNNPWLELTLHEGKQHEVRRLLEAVGHPVSKLRRVAIGPVLLKGLETGEFRPLLPEEVAGLLRGEGAPPTPVRSPRRGRAAHRRPGPAAAPARARATRGFDDGTRRASEGKTRVTGRGDRGGHWPAPGGDRNSERGQRGGAGRGRAPGRSGSTGRGPSVPPWVRREETITGGRARGEAERAGRARSQQEWADHGSRKGGRGQQDQTVRGSRRVGASGRGRGGSAGSSGASTTSIRGAHERPGRGSGKGARGRGELARRSGASTVGGRGGQGRSGRSGSGSRGRRR